MLFRSKAEGSSSRNIESCPPLLDDSDKDYVRKYNALISLYLHVPFPERLNDEDWAERVRQIEWLAKNGILGCKV